MKMKFSFALIGVFLMASAFAKDFVIESESIKSNQRFPVIYTCEGKDISPALSWHNAPENTQSFALIFSDPDAPSGTWYHWILYHLPSTQNKLAENAALPTGAQAGKNSWGKTKYGGPCPPIGSAPHHYIFTVYALDDKLSIKPNADAATLLKAMEGHILGTATLISTFSR